MKMEQMTPRITPQEKEDMSRAYADIHHLRPDADVLRGIINKIEMLEKVADIEETNVGRGLVKVVDGMVNMGVSAANILIKVAELIPTMDYYESGRPETSHPLLKWEKLGRLDRVPVKNAAETLAWLKEQAQQSLAEDESQEGETVVKE